MHRHKWIITKQEILPAPIDILKDARHMEISGNDLFTRDVIVNYKCETCGKEKVERI